MRYKIIITTEDILTANELRKMILESKIYNSSEHIINMRPIKEVCDECSMKE